VRIESCTALMRAVVMWLSLLAPLPAFSQNLSSPDIPPQFKLDMEMAARLRPQLIAQTNPATGKYQTGDLVLARLVQQLPGKFTWQVRIINNDQLNAYSSPDGSVYVESGLANLAGPSAGLWAAILSHEIAHIVRRDWARRYLYEKDLERRGGDIVLGDPGIPSATWDDSEKASADLGRFCRQMELDADREGLMLMAKAGYHPDFVPALHHLLHARGVNASTSMYAMHPCWEQRDQELSRAYTQASIEFEHLWPEWYASPGGNPPVVVFADEPTVKKTGGKDWQVQIPMRCQNLAGAVEVVLRADPDHHEMKLPKQSFDFKTTGDEIRQLTGCTSPKTTVVFSATEIEKRGTRWTDVYVLDAWGAVLARTDFPKLPR
jgi:hypothetical protein